MQAFTIIEAGSLQGAVAPDGAVLRVDDDGSVYRDGQRWVLGGVALFAARVGVYSKNVFARGKTDGKLWLATAGGWQEQTDTSTTDPAFVATMMSVNNEPT